MFWFGNDKISSKFDLLLYLKLFFRFTVLENNYYFSENVNVTLVVVWNAFFMPFPHISNITADTSRSGALILIFCLHKVVKCTFPNMQGIIMEIVLIGIRLKLFSLCCVIYTIYLNSMSCFISSFCFHFIWHNYLSELPI